MKHHGHLLLDEVTLAPSMEWAAAFPGWCFLRVQQGEGYWLGRDAAVEANAGDMLVLSPQRSGVFRASQLGEVTLRYFRFCPDLLSGFLTLLERRHFETLAARASRSCLRVEAGWQAARQFGEVCEEARASHGLLLRCRVLQIAASLFEQELERPGPSNRAFLPASQRIRVYLDALTEAEMMDLSPGELATRCGCSVRHFNRLFKESLGVSHRARQTELRLLKARQLLSETRASVRHVAVACGYRHLGLFLALFKRQFGVTPTEYRTQAALVSPQDELTAAPSS